MIKQKNIFKFFITCVVLLGSSLSVLNQELQHEAVAVNIEIPVRVFQKDVFCEDLNITDFEIYEDGVLQKVQAVYLVKETDITREESQLSPVKAKEIFAPQVSRHFVLIFEVNDYLPKLAKAIDYFFNEVFSPQDSLTIITPLKTYSLKGDALTKLSRDQIIGELTAKLKHDIAIANAEYKSLLKDIEDLYTKAGIYRWETSDWKTVIRDLLGNFETYRLVSEKKLLLFSEFLKNKRGQKNVFMFYQKEMLPKYEPFLNSILTSGNPEENHYTLFEFLEITDFYHRDIDFDVKKIKRIFSDSSILFHFLLLTKTPMQNLDVGRMESLSKHGIRYAEQSEDIFHAFSEVAKATGGITESSFNAAAAFEKAVDAS